MAQAAYCSQCGTNVYVTPDGRCPQGHGPEFLSNFYETGEAPTTAEPAQTAYAGPEYTPAPAGYAAPVQPAKKSKVGLIIAIVLAVLVLCGVSVGVGMCVLVDNAEEAIDTAIEESTDITIDENTDAGTGTEGTTDSGEGATGAAGEMGPDTTPALAQGVVRVELGWDEASDLDLEIWDATGENLVVRALTENGADITDGTQGREYFDFTGDYDNGTYVISVYFAAQNNAPDAAVATVVVHMANGDTVTRSQQILWDPGQDQWHAFSIDASTGDIVDMDEFIDIETTE